MASGVWIVGANFVPSTAQNQIEMWQGIAEAAMVETMVAIPENKTVCLRANIDYDKLQFAWSLDEKNWVDIDPVLDSTILSDEYDGLNFTGVFVGMAVMDYRMQSKKARFDYLELN